MRSMQSKIARKLGVVWIQQRWWDCKKGGLIVSVSDQRHIKSSRDR